jgi:hypothetical protein
MVTVQVAAGTEADRSLLPRDLSTAAARSHRPVDHPRMTTRRTGFLPADQAGEAGSSDVVGRVAVRTRASSRRRCAVAAIRAAADLEGEGTTGLSPDLGRGSGKKGCFAGCVVPGTLLWSASGRCSAVLGRYTDRCCPSWSSQSSVPEIPLCQLQDSVRAQLITSHVPGCYACRRTCLRHRR